MPYGSIRNIYGGKKVGERKGDLYGATSQASWEEMNNLKTFANSKKKRRYLSSFIPIRNKEQNGTLLHPSHLYVSCAYIFELPTTLFC